MTNLGVVYKLRTHNILGCGVHRNLTISYVGGQGGAGAGVRR